MQEIRFSWTPVALNSSGFGLNTVPEPISEISFACAPRAVRGFVRTMSSVCLMNSLNGFTCGAARNASLIADAVSAI